jgi:hypothetical protein
MLFPRSVLKMFSFLKITVEGVQLRDDAEGQWAALNFV